MKTGAGGHILRSTARKDRHSKVLTAKGPRDRRLRLSAHTAIQFYDLQDRLGYDRPSNTVDWLINKAKFAIDNLAESQNYDSQLQMQPASETFAPPLESFFPTTSATASINFQGYPVDSILKPANFAEILGLSLRNFHDACLEDTSPSPADDLRLTADSIPARYEAEDAGLWLQRPLLGQNSEAAAAISQRGTLQSSLGHSVPIRGWRNQRTHPNQQSSLGG